MASKKLPDPLIAGAGLIDFFAEKLQEYGPKLQAKAQELPADAQKFAAELPTVAKEFKRLAQQIPTELARLAQQAPAAAGKIRDKARETDFATLRTSAEGVKETASQTAQAFAESAANLYSELLKRGERLIAERAEERDTKVKRTTSTPGKKPATKKPAGKPKNAVPKSRKTKPAEEE
jgi:hypothetical protein